MYHRLTLLFLLFSFLITSPVLAQDIINFEVNAGLFDPPELSTGAQPTSYSTQRSTLYNVQLTFAEPVFSDLEMVLERYNSEDHELEESIPIPRSLVLFPDASDLSVVRVYLTTLRHLLTDGVYRLVVSVENEEGLPHTFYINPDEENRFYRLLGAFTDDDTVNNLDLWPFIYWWGRDLIRVPDYLDTRKEDGEFSIFDLGAIRNNMESSIEYPEMRLISEGQLFTSDGAEHSNFGDSFGILGDVAVVGATGETVGSNDFQGAAYLYHRSNGIWSEQEEIIASDGGPYQLFGTSVAISEDTVMIGASRADGSVADTGAVYVFDRVAGSVIETQKLSASDGIRHQGFGQNIALSGDVAVINAFDGRLAPGAAYIFERDGNSWLERQKLTSSDRAENDAFGSSMAVIGNMVFIGDHLNDRGGENVGAVFVYQKVGGVWTEVQVITPSDGERDDRFGSAIAIDGRTLVVGAFWNDNANNSVIESGAAYVFEFRNGRWMETQTLYASDPGFIDNFGSTVSISGDKIIVGSYGADIDSGAAYIYERQDDRTWSEIVRVSSGNDDSGDFYGNSVAVSGNTFLVGAQTARSGELEESPRTGIAFFYDVSND